MSNIKERQSNFELLRILSMVLIVAHHYAIHGGFQLDPNVMNINKIIYYILVYGGKLGVNLFVMISGYFLINSNFNAKKAVKLWIDVSFFSIFIGLYFIIFKDYHLTKLELFKLANPIIYGSYWFATTYFALYLFSKYLNIFIKYINKSILFKLIWFLTIILSFLPTFLNGSIASSYLLWFILLYSIAAYIKLYDPEIFNKKGYIKAAFIFYIILILLAIIIDIIGNHFSWLEAYPTHFSNLQTPTMLFLSILLFVGFKNIHISYSKIINAIAACSFGVYLIHDNEMIRHYLWIDIFKNYMYFDNKYFIIYALITIIFVYIGCTIISALYYFFIRKVIYQILDKIWPMIAKASQIIYRKANALLFYIFNKI